mgnify:CR=1 FL=1
MRAARSAPSPYRPIIATDADGTLWTGDVGVDVYERQLHPDTDKDFMSYCRPIWVSAFPEK